MLMMCPPFSQVFLPKEDDQQERAKAIIAATAEELGYAILGWRALPTDSAGVGRSALAVEPAMFQMFLVPGETAMFASLDLEQQVPAPALAVCGCHLRVGRICATTLPLQRR